MNYKYIENGIITYIGKSNRIPTGGVEITSEEKAQLEAIIASKPADTLESIYRLFAETMQYEPFVRTHEETVQWYVEQVNSGMSLDEVPEDYRAEVEAQVNPTEPDPEQAVVDSIMQEVSSYGY